MQVIIKIEDALRVFGTQANIASALGISRQAVNQWGEIVPEESASKLALLRPDLPREIVMNEKAQSEAN